MGKRWFYSAAAGEVGPVSAQELRALAERGVIEPATRVRSESSHWADARKIRGLFPAELDDRSDIFDAITAEAAHGPPQEPPAGRDGSMPPQPSSPFSQGASCEINRRVARVLNLFANCLMAIGFIVAGLGSFGLAIALFWNTASMGVNNIGLISDRETIALISAAATASGAVLFAGGAALLGITAVIFALSPSRD